jgi:uncharacterized membrane protein
LLPDEDHNLEENTVNKWNPAVGKVWLHLTAGLMWSGVGIMLVLFAARWLGLVENLSGIVLLIAAGLALGAAIYAFGFSKLALKNIQRILDIAKERICLFAFQRWSSYPLVLVMIALGIYLRAYSPIPKPYLAIVYLGLGSSLFFSSIHYYRQVFRMLPQRSRHSG